MAAANTDYFTEVGNPGTATTLAAPGHTIAGTTFNVISTTNYPTTTGAIFAVDTFTTQIVNGVSTAVRTPGSYTEWEGTVTNATTISNATLRYGTDQNYSAGASTRVYIPVASSRENRFAQGMVVQHNQDGTHGAVTATSVVASGTITAANFIQSGGAGAAGWTVGLANPNTVTALGNRSYSMVFNGTDLTSTVSAGMRLRTQRTVAAPTQSTSLNGTTQFYNKSSPVGMAQTDSITEYIYCKLTAYNSASVMISRANGTTDGWNFFVNSSGQVSLGGARAADDLVTSSQTVPLNKWIHISASINTTTTTGVITFDGVTVPSVYTNNANTGFAVPTADYRIGAGTGGTLPFPGKIAQVASFNAVIAPATILTYISQGLAGTETNQISAYSFNGASGINDLNANANNLTANGSAVATNADSPFGGQADGTISSTLDYAIIKSTSFSTNTTLVVQVPEGNTIPTTGGVSAVSYSTQESPYNMPRGKFAISVYDATIAANLVAVGVFNPVSGIRYVNANTGGGLMYLSQTGSVKTLTGKTVNCAAIATNGTQALSVTFPLTFSLTPTATTTATDQAVDTRVISYVQSGFPTTTSMTITFQSNAAAANATAASFYTVVGE